jgi:hypothetical protein
MKGGMHMKATANLPVLPELSAINFEGPAEVSRLVRERSRSLFGTRNDGYIDTFMDAIEGLFEGRNPEFLRMDTAYHNIEHTLQATLCLSELIKNRQQAPVLPRISFRDFKRGIVAILFHDIGYLKKASDKKGTGAKYTHVHEQRSCQLVREYLGRKGWPEDDIVFVENLISSTGPTADLTRIEYRSEVERTLGQIVCTADYVGQMSDPGYPDKLKVLFLEFEESYRYQGIPRGKWPFDSYESLLRSTPAFWSKFVQYKMNVECGGVWEFLKDPVTGENRYMDAIERNMSEIDKRIEQLDKSRRDVKKSGLSARL